MLQPTAVWLCGKLRITGRLLLPRASRRAASCLIPNWHGCFTAIGLPREQSVLRSKLPMRILLEYCWDHPSSRNLYGYVAASLRRRGMEVAIVQDVTGMDVSSYDVLISHDYVDRRGIDESATCVYGGREMTRPEEMAVIAASGVPVMPWTLATDEAEVLDLFGRWRAQRLLLKRSGTFKGDGVTVSIGTTPAPWCGIRNAICSARSSTSPMAMSTRSKSSTDE
jgi:hypothetical protein